MKLTKFLLYACCAVLTSGITSCTDDDKNEDAADLWTLPVTDFLQSKSEIQAYETQRGFTTTENGATQLKASKRANGTTIEFTYNFNPENNSYEYMHGSYASSNDLKAIVKLLGENAYNQTASAFGINVYTNEASYVRYVIDTEAKQFYAMPASNGPLAWGRIDALDEADQAGLLVPYLGKYATVELVALYEKYHGATLNVVDSKVENGVYVYDVASNTKGYTQVKYWFDVATKSKLEEAAVYFDANKRPTTNAVQAYMDYLGLTYTSMTDPTDGSSVYFNYKTLYTAYLLMDQSEDASQTFKPNIHFTFSDLTNQLPPQLVDFPEPITEFGTLTMDEAVEQYKQMPYFTGTAEDGFGGALGLIITTSSADFPQILIMNDDDKYYAAMMLPSSELVLRSPAVKEWLENHEYEYKPEASILPTYVRKDRSVMAQFDLTGEFSGLPSLSFQPNEYEGE